MPRISARLVKRVVESRVGNDALGLALTLNKFGELSEFKLAKLLREDINSVRTKLYHLQQHNLLNSRKRKSEESGWYVYYWSLNPKGFRDMGAELVKARLREVEEEIEKLQRENQVVCPNGCLSLSNEDALEMNYQCCECGALLTPANHDKRIERLNALRDRLMKSMGKPPSRSSKTRQQR